jgi:hypothetical protein
LTLHDLLQRGWEGGSIEFPKIAGIGLVDIEIAVDIEGQPEAIAESRRERSDGFAALCEFARRRNSDDRSSIEL